MTAFQIITIIFSGVTLLVAIFGVYVKLMIEITKLQTKQTAFQKELDMERAANLRTENLNRDDHKEILKKIDLLINREYEK